jgi:hypothetical protein
LPLVPVYWRATPPWPCPSCSPRSRPPPAPPEGRRGARRRSPGRHRGPRARPRPHRSTGAACHRGWIPGVLSQRPAVLAGQLGQQPAHERGCSPPGFHPSEVAGDTAQQLIQGLLPAGGIYAWACGHRLILVVCTAPDDQRWPFSCANHGLTSQITKSGWSTRYRRPGSVGGRGNRPGAGRTPRVGAAAPAA